MSGERAPVTPARALSTVPGSIPGRRLAAWLAAIALGVAGFLQAREAAPQRAWMSVWSNFLFWTSLSIAGVMFGAILQAAKGHWGKPFRRVAEGAAAFLPLSFLLFLLLYAGADQIFPWLGPAEGAELNRTWLTKDGVFLRDGILLLLLYGASFLFLRSSLRVDAPLLVGRHTGWRRRLVSALGRGWGDDEEEVARCRRRIGWLSPTLILAWAIVFTVLAFDLSMSLVPGFVSVIWGPYFFVGGWLCLLALVGLLSHVYRRRYELDDVWGRWEFHDLGKLTFAFVVFWTYLWFAQFLVIWYGNLPREAAFFLPRTGNVFSRIYWLQMVLIFGLPFLFLLGRKPKMRSGWLAFVAVLILTGFWIERYNLVVPSVWQGAGVPLGWPEALISLGFLGLFGLSYSLFASTFPKIPVRDTIAVGSPQRGP
ncbi:MAG: hypothetical protein ACE5HP_11080 [Gemmatimonadota bacterium]